MASLMEYVVNSQNNLPTYCFAEETLMPVHIEATTSTEDFNEVLQSGSERSILNKKPNLHNISSGSFHYSQSFVDANQQEETNNPFCNHRPISVDIPTEQPIKQIWKENIELQRKLTAAFNKPLSITKNMSENHIKFEREFNKILKNFEKALIKDETQSSASTLNASTSTGITNDIDIQQTLSTCYLNDETKLPLSCMPFTDQNDAKLKTSFHPMPQSIQKQGNPFIVNNNCIPNHSMFSTHDTINNNYKRYYQDKTPPISFDQCRLDKRTNISRILDYRYVRPDFVDYYNYLEDTCESKDTLLQPSREEEEKESYNSSRACKSLDISNDSSNLREENQKKKLIFHETNPFKFPWLVGEWNGIVKKKEEAKKNILYNESGIQNYLSSLEICNVDTSQINEADLIYMQPSCNSHNNNKSILVKSIKSEDVCDNPFQSIIDMASKCDRNSSLASMEDYSLRGSYSLQKNNSLPEDYSLRENESGADQKLQVALNRMNFKKEGEISSSEQTSISDKESTDSKNFLLLHDYNNTTNTGSQKSSDSREQEFIIIDGKHILFPVYAKIENPFYYQAIDSIPGVNFLFYIEKESWILVNEFIKAFTELNLQPPLMPILKMFTTELRELKRSEYPLEFLQLDKLPLSCDRDEKNQIIVLNLISLRGVLDVTTKSQITSYQEIQDALRSKRFCTKQILKNIVSLILLSKQIRQDIKGRYRGKD